MKDPLQLQKLRDAYARRQEPESIRRITDAYWAFLVSLAGIASIVGIAYGAWELLAPSDDNASADGTAGIVGFNREQLQVLVKAFEKQQGDFEALMKQ